MLFRKEVVEAKNQTILGDARIRLKSWYIYAVLALTLILAALTASIVFLNLPKSTTVIGWIVPTSGQIDIRASFSGRLVDLKIPEQDEIREGQVLATLLAEEHRDDSGVNVIHELSVIVENLQEQKQLLEGRKQLLTQDLARLDDFSSKETERIDQEINIFSEQLVAVNELEAASRGFQEEIGGGMNVEVYSFVSQSTAVKSKLVGLERAKADLRFEFSQDKSDINRELNSIDRDLLLIQERLSNTRIQIQEHLIKTKQKIHAPVSGRLVSKAPDENELFQQGDVIFSLHSQDTTPSIEVFVPIDKAGNLSVEQAVAIYLPRSDGSDRKPFRGEIVEISERIINPNEIPVRLEINAPVYQVQVKLLEQERSQSNQALRMGAKVDARIFH